MIPVTRGSIRVTVRAPRHYGDRTVEITDSSVELGGYLALHPYQALDLADAINAALRQVEGKAAAPAPTAAPCDYCGDDTGIVCMVCGGRG